MMGRAKVTDRTEVTGIASRSPRFPASQDLQLVKNFLHKKCPRRGAWTFSLD